MEYYYQIKGKANKDYEYATSQNWSFPPIFSGKVEANNRKQAKEMICELYEKQFPTRVLQKDLDSNEFLLSIEDMKDGTHFHRLFELRTCTCGNTFYIIDKYNDRNCHDKGAEFCSMECKDNARAMERFIRNQNEVLSGSASPVIYKITNKITNKVYIGKTTQVFTLRWYQHFFQHGSCKFHDAIRNSKVTDWLFEIIEIVIIPEHIKKVSEVEPLIIERERHWINEYNSIAEGYNTL